MTYEGVNIYQTIQLFIRSKTLNVAIFKYFLHKIRETILHRKYQLIKGRCLIITHSSPKLTIIADYAYQ